jgi:hypothetical protein
MWNNAEHLTAYLTVPSMGAVLHTLNLRLFPEQLIYIVNHAEDRVVIVDSTLIPLLAGVLPHLTTLRHIVVVGDGDTSGMAETGRGQGHRHPPLGRPAARQAGPLRVAGRGRERRGRAVLHLGHHRQPQGCRLQPPLDLPALDAGVQLRGVRAGTGAQGDRGRAAVPRHGLGPARTRPSCPARPC